MILQRNPLGFEKKKSSWSILNVVMCWVECEKLDEERLECLLSAWRAAWKVNSIQEFPGQGTLESWPFSILGPTHFHTSCNFREYICGHNSLTERWAVNRYVMELCCGWADLCRGWLRSGQSEVGCGICNFLCKPWVVRIFVLRFCVWSDLGVFCRKS